MLCIRKSYIALRETLGAQRVDNAVIRIVMDTPLLVLIPYYQQASVGFLLYFSLNLRIATDRDEDLYAH